MRKSGILSAVLGLAVAASAGSAFAATGPVDDTGPAAARYTQALNLLEDKGYGNFTNFHKSGNEFQATVTRNGKSMTVTVNPDSGVVNTRM